MIVYIVEREGQRTFDDGQAVVIHARFYKRVDAVARDGQVHRYPAFVGAFPSGPAATEPAVASMLVVLVPVAVLLVVFVVLLLYVRRSRTRHRSSRPAIDQRLEVDESPGLPDDPAEALAEMHRRAEADET